MNLIGRRDEYSPASGNKLEAAKDVAEAESPLTGSEVRSVNVVKTEENFRGGVDGVTRQEVEWAIIAQVECKVGLVGFATVIAVNTSKEAKV